MLIHSSFETVGRYWFLHSRIEHLIAIYTNLFTKKNFSSFNETMKRFQSIYSYCAILGISPLCLHQKYPFNAKVLMIYLCYCLQITLHCAYLYRNVLNFEERLNLFFWISLLFIIAACHTAYVIKVEELYQCLDSCEKIIDESK